MMDAVIHLNFSKIEGTESQTGCIHTELIRVGAPLMMRIDPAVSAEMMFRDPGVEPIGTKHILPCQKGEIRQAG